MDGMHSAYLEHSILPSQTYPTSYTTLPYPPPHPTLPYPTKTLPYLLHHPTLHPALPSTPPWISH